MSAYNAILTRSLTMSFLLHPHNGGHSLVDRGGVSLASVLWGMDRGGGRSQADGSCLDFSDPEAWEMAMPLVLTPTKLEGSHVLGRTVVVIVK